MRSGENCKKKCCEDISRLKYKIINKNYKWKGEDLDCSGIIKGDNLTDIIKKLNESSCNGGGGSDEINVSSTVVNNGSDGGLFFNDNGIFEEMNGIKFDNTVGMFYNENFDEGGLVLTQTEVAPNISVNTIGIAGFPDNTGKQLFIGYQDLSNIGSGKRVQIGWQNASGVGSFININAEKSVRIQAEENVNIQAEENVNINALGDNSNLWAEFGNGNSQNTNVSFTINTSKNNLGYTEQYVFKQENEQFNLINNNQFWDTVFSFDLLNKQANMNGEVICQELRIIGNSKFGQQLSTGQGATVDDVIQALQNMGILTQ